MLKHLQSHSRSVVSVAINSPHVTSYSSCSYSVYTSHSGKPDKEKECFWNEIFHLVVDAILSRPQDIYIYIYNCVSSVNMPIVTRCSLVTSLRSAVYNINGRGPRNRNCMK